jgi:HEPN domain-containing protein
MRQREPAGSALDWIAYAEGDLLYARLGRSHNDVPREFACFHAQQAAEKALKAVLLACGARIPFVHDIGYLMTRLRENGVAVPPKMTDAETLTDYAAELRYPGGEDKVDGEELDDAIRLAQVVLDWAKARVQR